MNLVVDLELVTVNRSEPPGWTVRAGGTPADPGQSYVYSTYMSNTLTGRLNFRVTDEQERALRQAAAVTGQSLSGFVLSTAVEHAQQVLDRANHIEVSALEFKRFVEDLDRPPEVVPELVALFARPTRIPDR